MRTIDHIIIHCSATPEGASLSVAEFKRIHLSRGFRGIGYHFYVRRDGKVFKTRPLELPGAHAKGHNAHSIGICYEGGLDGTGHAKDTRTLEQRTSLHLLVYQLLKKYHNVRICGHRDLSPDRNGNGVIEPEEWVKECPCFDVAREF